MCTGVTAVGDGQGPRPSEDEHPALWLPLSHKPVCNDKAGWPVPRAQSQASTILSSGFALFLTVLGVGVFTPTVYPIFHSS